MELREYLEIVRRRWLIILVVAFITVAAAGGWTLITTPKYTASTSLFFGVQGGESVTDLAQGSTFTEKQMASYADVATSPLVLDRVIKDLGLSTTAAGLAGEVTATAQTGKVILEVTASDEDPKRAAEIANSVAKQLVTVAGDLVPERQDGSKAVLATILAPAEVPAHPSSPLVARNLALGLALGLLLGFGAAFLRQVLDTKIRSEQDLRTVTDTAVLGVVPFDPVTPAHPVIMHEDATSPRSEAVRRLRTNLQFVDVVDDARSIVITSSVPGEGKSTTVINLALSLADAGLKVILIDSDLRRPSVAEYLGLEGAVGLTTVLIGRATVDDVVQPWRSSNLHILPAGQIPPNPSELLGSPAMSRLLAELAGPYDIVLLDSPPLLPVTDAAVLSKIADGALVIVGADRIKRAQLREALDSLTTVGAHVHGLVLNKIAKRDSNRYVYEAGYGPQRSNEAPVPVTLPKRAHPEVG